VRRALAVAAVALATVAGCGAPEELSEDEGRTLVTARERLDDAIDTEETLRTSRAEARRLRARVQELVSDGSFDNRTLDEFGIARLGQLREVAPSLVLQDLDGNMRGLDRASTAAFLRYADRNAPRALVRPASRAVGLMVHTIEEGDAGKDTKIPTVGKSAEAYLREAERNVKDIWPLLAKRLADLRQKL
jgi:hypothetical protein